MSRALMSDLFAVWRNRSLIAQMTRREVVGRYRGSMLGLFWSFFNPMLLLTVYTFVFSVIFKARWGVGGDSKSQFAIILFVGMIAFQIFSETINRAPSLIIANVNYVKKVVFPLEILPVVAFLAASFHALVSLLVLLAAMLLLGFKVYWTIILFPLIFVPFALFILGFAWFLASIGVFIQDIGQSIGLVTTVLMFLTPVFYPITSIPVGYRKIVLLNPLAFVIEQSRQVLIWGNVPDWLGLLMLAGASLVVAAAGFAWFQRTRRGFADVL